jgi:4-alpha-glucanotransferase
MSDAALRALAAQAGIAAQWTDAFGQEQQVCSDSLRALLAALQLPAGNDRQCEESLAGLHAQGPRRAVAAADHCSVGQAVALPGLLPVGARYRLRLEGGYRHGRPAANRRRQPGGKRSVKLPAQQTPGYHTLEAGGQCCVLAVAPQRCFSVADAMANRAAPGRAALGSGGAGLQLAPRR